MKGATSLEGVEGTLVQVTRFSLSLVTDADGLFTGYIQPNVSGFIHQIRYVEGTIEAIKFLITLEGSGVRILNAQTSITADTTWLPRHVTHDNDDASELTHSVLGNSTTVAIDGAPIAVGGERIKVVCTAATASKVGTLYVWIVT